MSIALALVLILAVLGASWLKGQGVARTNDGVFGGVCAGIARHFGWDLLVVRIITVILALTVAGPVLAYILLWIILDRR